MTIFILSFSIPTMKRSQNNICMFSIKNVLLTLRPFSMKRFSSDIVLETCRSGNRTFCCDLSIEGVSFSRDDLVE